MYARSTFWTHPSVPFYRKRPKSNQTTGHDGESCGEVAVIQNLTGSDKRWRCRSRATRAYGVGRSPHLPGAPSPESDPAQDRCDRSEMPSMALRLLTNTIFMRIIQCSYERLLITYAYRYPINDHHQRWGFEVMG